MSTSKSNTSHYFANANANVEPNDVNAGLRKKLLKMNRRKFIRNATASVLTINPIAGTFAGNHTAPIQMEILNPQNRVPVSMIIDDSTALVNMAHFGIPQFAETFPENYKQEWRKLPREIPDSFVAEFIEWCDQKGVKGKYSMVPYPACTGWLHRYIPGWSSQELKSSLDLVRNDVTKNWDIHPEMISHTRVIDIKTGLPFPSNAPEFMENWEWSQSKSADELTGYISYALNVLKEAGLDCDGVTTPGGFCHRNIENLAIATHDSVLDINKHDISHFFRAVITDKEKSVAPIVMHHKNIQSSNPSCSVHIIGCTGDWFGGWDGLTPGDTNRFISEDLSSGRMVDVIESGEPALMVCHWPGIYYNGDKLGFNIFKEVVSRLEQKYGSGISWMKLSEISRYWAAKEFVNFEALDNGIAIDAPFGTRNFTLKVNLKVKSARLIQNDKQVILTAAASAADLPTNSIYTERGNSLLCFDLPQGKSELRFS